MDALERFNACTAMLGPAMVLWYAAAAWLVARDHLAGAGGRGKYRARDLELLLLSPFALPIWGAIAFGLGAEGGAIRPHAWPAYMTHGLAIGQIGLAIGLWLRYAKDLAYALPAVATAPVLAGQAWVLAAKAVSGASGGA